MQKGTIYLLQNLSDGAIKIGFTRGRSERRMKQLSTGSSGELQLVRTTFTDYGTALEAYLHNVFYYKKVRGEWYNLTEDDINIVMKLAAKFEENVKVLVENENYFIKKFQNF
jgi:hypothetical protein